MIKLAIILLGLWLFLLSCVVTAVVNALAEGAKEQDNEEETDTGMGQPED